ncbi:hypothetical protein L228DRAFT_259034 [Xylona heveae TC161]|uniref:DNA/RNA-binding protein Alba-like domain-containing protein n=1 Tax=Xylona heveae (strain CBS 132557 / TC161) TaxID=1328760 RepID=A0A165J2D0_XYLHT|nr:hypothetical protein L228DRAFT_259034 [Xylona heveae TC161]KZF25639.1 hypothetical protein L228DRAFT_259034 [Xylona heveae TC161]
MSHKKKSKPGSVRRRVMAAERAQERPQNPPAVPHSATNPTIQSSLPGQEQTDSPRPAKRARIDTGEPFENPGKVTQSPSRDVSAVPPRSGDQKPAPASSFSSSSSLPACIEGFESSYDVTAINIISASSIQENVLKVIKVLDIDLTEAKPKTKAPLVILTGQGAVTGKLISIVEIAKRNAKNKGVRVFQYSSLGSISKEEMLQKKQQQTRQGQKNEEVDRTAREGEEVESTQTIESQEGFALALPSNGGQKKARQIPVLTIYLSNSTIKHLKEKYGEQPRLC